MREPPVYSQQMFSEPFFRVVFATKSKAACSPLLTRATGAHTGPFPEPLQSCSEWIGSQCRSSGHSGGWVMTHWKLFSTPVFGCSLMESFTYGMSEETKSWIESFTGRSWPHHPVFKCLNQVIVGRREFGDMDNSSDEEQHGQSKGSTTFVEPAGVTTFQHRKHVQVHLQSFEFSSAAQDSLEYWNQHLCWLRTLPQYPIA